jgi:2-C-methyl-D-erythritol 4-phosphate cytidylyltransferase
MARDVAVILAAAGKSTRFKDPFSKKVFTLCSGKPVWQHSAQLFADHPRVGQIIMAIAPEDKDIVQEKFSGNLTMLGVELVLGGNERYESIRNAIQRIKPNMALVAIHDAARPCLTRSSVDDVLAVADRKKAAILAAPIRGTVKRCKSDDSIEQTVERAGLWQAQTPQVFAVDILQKSYARLTGTPTDDSQVVESAGYTVYCVEGPESNIKITTKADLKVAESFLKVPAKTKDNPFF